MLESPAPSPRGDRYELLEDKRFVTGLETPAGRRPAWTCGVLHQETRAESPSSSAPARTPARQPVAAPDAGRGARGQRARGRRGCARSLTASHGAPYEVRLAGAGGQGIVVLAGLLLAEAAVAPAGQERYPRAGVRP